MYVVRHYNERIQFHIGTDNTGLQPFICRDPTIFIQLHFLIGNISKQAFPVP